MSGFLVIIVIISAIFSYVGIRFIENRVVAEAQHRVGSDLNAAREIYLNELRTVHQVVRFTADRFFLKSALLSGHPDRAAAVLAAVLRRGALGRGTATARQGRGVRAPG